MKYYIIAGEASGDLHGSNLLKELRRLQPDAQFRGWGGDLMQRQGCDLVKHYRDLAFMGFKEVIANLRTILKNIQFAKDDIIQWQPDAVILIDYPGFNLRLADFCKSIGLPVIYYISPQVWAWKENRVKKIKSCVDELICILPFEVPFYEKWGMQVHFVGHPLLDAVEGFEKDPQFRIHHGLDHRSVVALLPGSRTQEIKKMLPVMLEMAERFPERQFLVAAAPGQPEALYHTFLKNHPEVKLVKGATYQLLAQADAALVTSGTATLETGMFGVPQVVCYRGSALSYAIGKRLVKIKFISLVNLILDRSAVCELIQADFNSKRLEEELKYILSAEGNARLKTDYAELKSKLGHRGASEKAAEIIVHSPAIRKK